MQHDIVHTQTKPRASIIVATLCHALSLCCNAQNPLHQFPRNFPVDGEAANLLRGNWCNGFWALMIIKTQ